MPDVSGRKLTRREVQKAEQYLTHRDCVLGDLIVQHGPCDLHASRKPPFSSLARTIIGQQLSVKAANTIARRILDTLNSKTITPESWQAASDDDLRAAGLSRPKIRYINELASNVISGTIDFEQLEDLDESSSIQILTSMPGVGKWTAEMYLIFCQKRPDILALDDAALRRAVKILYPGNELETFKASWAPYCSVASWYLWKYLDS